MSYQVPFADIHPMAQFFVVEYDGKRFIARTFSGYYHTPYRYALCKEL